MFQQFPSVFANEADPQSSSTLTMSVNVRRGLWCIWGVGAFGWVATHFWRGGWPLLRTVMVLAIAIPA